MRKTTRPGPCYRQPGAGELETNAKTACIGGGNETPQHREDRITEPFPHFPDPRVLGKMVYSEKCAGFPRIGWNGKWWPRPAPGVDSGGGGGGGGGCLGDRYRGSLLCMTEAVCAGAPTRPTARSFIIRRKSISSEGGKIQFGPRFQSLERMEGDGAARREGRLAARRRFH